jgi:hypothetical protein
MKSWVMNWEEQYEHWKVCRWIEKGNMNIEKLNDELRRAIWKLKIGIINWEKQYEHWKVEWWIEKSNMKIENWNNKLKSNMSIEKLNDELGRATWKLKIGMMNWEREHEHWKVEWWIGKSNINIENWNNKLRRAIWRLTLE